jgi:hypothetical protein
MSSEPPHRVVAFRGGVSCRRDSNGPLGLTLLGRTEDHPDEGVSLAFSGRAPDALPEVLEDPSVYRIDDGGYRITSIPQEWVVEASAVHLHREMAASFYRAVPPRAVPLSKRLFWSLVIAMAGSSWGKRLLLALRRR